MGCGESICLPLDPLNHFPKKKLFTLNHIFYPSMNNVLQWGCKFSHLLNLDEI